MTGWRRERGWEGGLVWSGKGPGDAVTELLRARWGMGPPGDMRCEEQTVAPCVPLREAESWGRWQTVPKGKDQGN